METSVRVRFAPSPTGGLHIGGIRTALYNYLLARKYKGKFILRIEDTDKNRFSDQAEKFIFDCLNWCNISPDESPQNENEFGPFKQSQRLQYYHQFAQQLLNNNQAYYAFDTSEELDLIRQEHQNFLYKASGLPQLKNSINCSAEEVQIWLKNKNPYSIRLKIPENENILCYDEIRGVISYQSQYLDDKILIKSDGYPTYHLAVVVDDFLMKISHVLRGEEWLSTFPIHCLLWDYLFKDQAKPKWIHLPLILKPSGQGKLSKRDSEKYGFPIYAMQWPILIENHSFDMNGFKEFGFLPEALINFLALLGWNNGSAKELYSLDELVQEFSLDQLNKVGANFDFNKAKWFNHQWIIKLSAQEILPHLNSFLTQWFGVEYEKFSANQWYQLIQLVKDRCELLTDFKKQLYYFLNNPILNTDLIINVAKTWTNDILNCLENYARSISLKLELTADNYHQLLLINAEAYALEAKKLLMPLRLCLVGDKYGPDLFKIAENLSSTAVKERIITFINFVRFNCNVKTN